MARARVAAAVLIGLLGAVAVAAAAFGLQTSLGRPPRPVVLAARAVGEIEQAQVVRTVERLGPGRTLSAVCSSSGRTSLVSVGDGALLAVRGVRVHALGGIPSRRFHAVVEADLAGCPRLLGLLLQQRVRRALARGDAEHLLVPVRRGSRQAYRIVLTPGPLQVDLEIDRRTLEPLGVRVESAGPAVSSSIAGRQRRES